MRYILLFLTSLPALAATSGTITLSGVVPAVTAIVITQYAASTTLDFSAGAVNLPVAGITETNNTTSGYTVLISSDNSGLLKNGTLGSVAYTARYATTSFSLSSTPVMVTNVVTQSSIVSANKQVDISFTGQALGNLMQGSYSDTLTLTIQAN